MPNRVIEIHDSVLDGISVLDGHANLNFRAVYIHQSDGKPGIDAGTGWVQKARLQIKEALIEGSFSEIPSDLHDGHIKLGESVLDNEIPIPLTFNGDVELRLESWSDVVLIKGRSAELELIGEPKYVEEFRPHSK